MGKKLTVTQKLRYCVGCENNYYNSKKTSGGGDGLCWSIHDAEVVARKKVPLDQLPPWNQKPRKVLSCYHQWGYAYIAADKAY